MRQAKSSQLVRSALSDQVYEKLKERILDQRVSAGERMNIDALSRELGVSSSPTREALVRLASERLLISEFYSGYVVAPPPDISHLYDLFDFRLLIEPSCAKLGAEAGDAQVLAKLERASKKMAGMPRRGTRYREYRAFNDADGEFHQAIVDSARNQVISLAYSEMHVVLLQARFYLYRQSNSIGSPETINEHEEIISAYRAGDGARAAESIKQHLLHGRKRLSDAAKLTQEASRK